jgi:uncharacterized OB-fold protein
MHIPRYWRAQSQRYSLTGEICKQCGAGLFPPRDVCPECRELALEPFASDLNDELYPLFTQVPKVHGERLPQAMGLIRLRV